MALSKGKRYYVAATIEELNNSPHIDSRGEAHVVICLNALQRNPFERRWSGFA